MKTLLLSTLALTVDVGAFINVELAFSILITASILFIAFYDYAPQHLVTNMEV